MSFSLFHFLSRIFSSCVSYRWKSVVKSEFKTRSLREQRDTGGNSMQRLLSVAIGRSASLGILVDTVPARLQLNTRFRATFSSSIRDEICCVPTSRCIANTISLGVSWTNHELGQTHEAGFGRSSWWTLSSASHVAQIRDNDARAGRCDYDHHSGRNDHEA